MSMQFDYVEFGYRLAIFFGPFLFALCFHEYAHGWVARLKGDRTAESMGRLTLNPLAHVDPLGTVILPIAAMVLHLPGFGWAKPVPVDPRNFKNPVNDMFWVALAGPLSNVLLAIVGAVARALAVVWAPEGGTSSALISMLEAFVLVNMFLAIFNMIPLHPLDGGKVLARFLPYRANRWLEDVAGQMNFILIGLFLIGGFKIIAVPAISSAVFLMTTAQVVLQGVG